MNYPATPELDKMIAARDSGKASTVEDFLRWLRDGQGYDIVRFDNDGENPVTCYDMEKLMCQFFGVDSQRVEAERRAVLGYVRDKNLEDTG